MLYALCWSRGDEKVSTKILTSNEQAGLSLESLHVHKVSILPALKCHFFANTEGMDATQIQLSSITTWSQANFTLALFAKLIVLLKYISKPACSRDSSLTLRHVVTQGCSKNLLMVRN